MASVIPIEITTAQGNLGSFYLGSDERDRELQIVAVQIDDTDGPFLLVIHVTPTDLRGNGSDA